ncbi:MAG: hypothetical protein ACE5E9_06880 [Nitrospinaceae bacterium]
MESGNESKRKLIEFLWVEINRAIINSPEVQSSIKTLQDLDLIDHVTDYNLMLDINALIELIQREKGNPSHPAIQVEKDASPPEKSAQNSSDEANTEPLAAVDGKKLTQNEILFQQHLEKNFDEAKWMKKVGIRYPN